MAYVEPPMTPATALAADLANTTMSPECGLADAAREQRFDAALAIAKTCKEDEFFTLSDGHNALLHAVSASRTDVALVRRRAPTRALRC